MVDVGRDSASHKEALEQAKRQSEALDAMLEQARKMNGTSKEREARAREQRPEHPVGDSGGKDK